MPRWFWIKKGDLEIALKSFIQVRWQNYLPKLVIHEKYEKQTKWVLRILAFLAIVSSLLAFDAWYAKLLLALGIFLVEQFLERAIFLYTSIYAQPMPNFTTESDKWTDMGFAYPGEPQPDLLNVVGPTFLDKRYAHNFFNLLRDWNYQQSEDMDNNIRLSFIMENEKQYTVYLYPNPKRKSVISFFKEAEEQQKYEKWGKEHQQLVMQMVFYKVFGYGGNLGLKRFLRIQPNDKPFWLQPFIKQDDGASQIMYKEKPILKYHFKLKTRKELRKNELEYQYKPNLIKHK